MREFLKKMVKGISDIDVRLKAIEYVLVAKEILDVKDIQKAHNDFTEMRDARVREYEERINPLTERLGTFAPYPSGNEYIKDKRYDNAHLLKW